MLIGERISLTIDSDTEQKIQTEVDKGHQPWRLEPIDVAHAALLLIDQHTNYNNCKLSSETDREAIVECSNEGYYLIYLKRMIRPGGIWTAIEIERKNSSETGL